MKVESISLFTGRQVQAPMGEMQPEDAFDAAHMAGASMVEAFLQALLRNPALAPAQARRHADNANVLVEFLANTYGKVPEQAHERDVWVFLFDYYIAQGPFAGAAVPEAPLSTLLLFEFIAKQRPVPELPWIRKACEKRAFYQDRRRQWDEIARSAMDPRADHEATDGAVEEWFEELTSEMRSRGLVPDGSLVKEGGQWLHHMGPIEAAIYDALCVVLARRARELGSKGVEGQSLEEKLVDEQEEFMRTRNRSLRVTPLEAIAREREKMGVDQEKR